MIKSQIPNYVTLFGHPIIPHRRLTASQQVYKIFIEEIHAGRWKVGTRLPGVIKICEQTGIGNKTIQEAFALLKKDGYIQSEPNKGTYLVSILPHEVNPTAHRIGILLTNEQAKTPYTLWLSHLFMDAALRHGLLGEVHIVDAQSDWNKVITVGNTFGPNVKSIISLIPFKTKTEFKPAEEAKLPVIFFCHMTDPCTPIVAFDVVSAFSELTHRIILAGHREIAFLSDNKLGARFNELHRSSYETVMNEYGLKVREYECDQDNPQQTETVIKKLADEKKVTAILSASLQLIEQGIFPAVQKLKIKIPKQLSIVSLGSTKFPWDEKLYTTGIELDFESIARICFDLLNQYVMTGDCRQTRTLIKGKFIPGNTLLEINAASIRKKEPAEPAE